MGEERSRVFDADAKRAIVNRLRRAEGQLAAVVRAVEGDVGCRAVVQRLSAVSSALDKAGFLVVYNALEECLADPDNDEGMNPEELQKLFMSLA